MFKSAAANPESERKVSAFCEVDSAARQT